METFKDIKGYEGIYQISNYGTVKALARTVTNKHGKPQNYPERVLKPEQYEMSNTKYCRVSLSKNHKVTRFLVHRLVAIHFIPNTLNKEHVNHIDNNGLNNHVSNLEWCTHSENMLHAQKQGRLFASQSKGGKNAGIAKERAEQRAKDLIGKTIHLWKVESFNGRKGVNKKYHVNCTCISCGTSRSVEVSCLLNGKTRGCSQKCVKKYLKDEDIV